MWKEGTFKKRKLKADLLCLPSCSHVNPYIGCHHNFTALLAELQFQRYLLIDQDTVLGTGDMGDNMTPFLHPRSSQSGTEGKSIRK